MQVIFTVNGPGEVSGWLHPLSAELKARYPSIRIHACVVPCVFSTGAETAVISALPCVDGVSGVGESMALAFRGRRPPGIERGRPTLLFHLGGDIGLSYLMGLQLRAPRYAYVEHPVAMHRLFARVFYNGLTRRPGEEAGGTVGELMVDAADLRRRMSPPAPRGQGPVVALFPGSRAYMTEHVLPYFAAIADRLAAQRPEVDWVLARADYLSLDFLRNFPPPTEGRRWPASAVTWREQGDAAWLETEAGTRIRILTGQQAVAQSDFALTIPGTNSGELAAAGVPMVVVLPTYIAETVPLPGLAGHVSHLPLFGVALKRAIARWRERRLGLVAQPNVRAGEMIVPEFIGQGMHDGIAQALEGLLDGYGRDHALRDRLRATMGRAGAARALADEIGNFFRVRPGIGLQEPQA